ncbi:MAG: DUF2207 domain-containing protein [Aerococcus suis]|nr:DUF2207 domain-containing protein [Aerococcus suis]
MTKWLWRIVACLSMCLIGVLGSESIANAAEISQYDVDVSIAADGTMTSKENIHYHLDKKQKLLPHQIAVGDNGEIGSLSIGMKAKEAKDYFPFAQSPTKDLGTYTLEGQSNMYKLELFNQMEEGDYIGQYETQIQDAWINYGEWQVLDLSFLNAPLASSNDTIVFHFPEAVNQDAVKWHVSNSDAVSLNWKNDQELVVEVGNRPKNEGIQLQLVVPEEVLPNNHTKGSESEGNQIVQGIEDKQQAAQAEITRQQRIIKIASVLLFLAILGFIGFSLWKKKITAQRLSHVDQTLLTQTNWTPAMIAHFLYHPSQWITTLLIMMNLVNEGHLALRFQTKGKQITDIYVQDQHAVTQTHAESLFMKALKIQHNLTGEDWVSMNEWQTNRKRDFRQLEQQLVKTTKRTIRKQHVYDSVNKGLTLVWLLLIVLSLGVLVISIYWQMSGHFTLYWPVLLLIIGLIILWLSYQWLLPLKSEHGVAVAKNYRGQLNQLKDSQQITDQLRYSQDSGLTYLYSWLTGDNRAYAKAIETSPYTIDLAETMSPVQNLTLKQLRIKLK